MSTVLLSLFKIISLFLIFLSYSLPARPTAVDYALSELLKAGWREEAAKAVVTVNSAWFTILKQEHKNDFYYQINLLKQLGHSIIVSRFLRKYPETAGLLALSDNPILLIKILKKRDCYNAITSFFAIHTSSKDVQLLTEALENHGDLMCQLAERGVLGAATVFIFPRHTRGAREYDAWLERVFDKYLWRSDDKLAEIIAFIIENGQTIRQRLDKDPNFYKRFRKELWPALMRVVDKNGVFGLFANDPYIWEVLALKEGEMLLNKWGLAQNSLLFGESRYLADMRPIIIQILLEGDERMVEALFRYKDEPLFHNLMRRPLSATSQAALATELLSLCPNYPCPELPYHLRYFASISDNVALAEDVSVLESGLITWVPFYGSYYAIKKMTQGRKLSGDDMLNLGFDALVFVPATFFAGLGCVQPLGPEIVIPIGVLGLEVLTFTPYSYHLVKPLGQFVILTGNRARKMLTQEEEDGGGEVAAFIKQSQEIFNGAQRVYYDVTQSLLFLHKKAGHRGELLEFEASIFMRNDAKVVMNPGRGLSGQFFRETAQRALSQQTAWLGKRAWQQNISAWWLMNAAVAP
jgi:hypothetical protein